MWVWREARIEATKKSYMRWAKKGFRAIFIFMALAKMRVETLDDNIGIFILLNDSDVVNTQVHKTLI